MSACSALCIFAFWTPHGLHLALDREGGGRGGDGGWGGGGEGRRFACPACRRRSWRSIETFRVHKASCSSTVQEVGAGLWRRL